MPEASGSGVADESDYSIFENKSGLAEDMKFLASMPELCDVTFLVGDTREPVCAVKAVLAARSRVFHKLLYQAPSPQRKKEPATRENKIRLFLKRSSEPLLNLQNAAQQRSGFTQQLAPIQEPQPNQHHTLIIEEFEPDVFRQLIEYIHTGCVTLQPRTLLGVMNAADYYGLDELRRACAGFVQCCITVDTVCALLASAERYIQYKCTKSLVQKVLEFVDEHGNEVLNLGSFTLLPQHVVRLILAREELRADEFTKFQAALMWSKKYIDNNQNTDLKNVIGNFLEYIQFHKIPTNVLMNEVHPLELVPSGIIMNALAYQADANSIDPRKLSLHRVRRQGRSMSVQSSLDPYGSNTTLCSGGSDVGSDQKQHSGKNGTAEQEQQQQQLKMQEKQDEEEDLQQHIEERNQHQQQQQQEQELQQQPQEEELKKQQEEEPNTEEEELSKEQQQEELKGKEEVDLSKEQLQQEVSKKEEEELSKEQQQEELKKQKEEFSKKQQQEEESKKEEEEELSKEQQEEELKDHQAENLEVQAQECESEKEQREEQSNEQEVEEKLTDQENVQELQQQGDKQDEIQGQEEVKKNKEEGVLEQQQEPQKEQECLDKKEEEKQKTTGKDRPMQLNLEELRYPAVQQEMTLQLQEKAFQRQLEEKRYEEQLEMPQLQQLQLHLEGKKPGTEKIIEQPKQKVVEARKPKKKERKDRVEIRVREPEVQKQEQPQDQKNGNAPIEGVSGFYIRLVVRQEGRANLVWLLKTHKF